MWGIPPSPPRLHPSQFSCWDIPYPVRSFSGSLPFPTIYLQFKVSVPKSLNMPTHSSDVCLLKIYGCIKKYFCLNTGLLVIEAVSNDYKMNSIYFKGGSRISERESPVYLQVKFIYFHILKHIIYLFIYLFIYLLHSHPPTPHTHTHIYIYIYIYICIYIYIYI